MVRYLFICVPVSLFNSSRSVDDNLVGKGTYRCGFSKHQLMNICTCKPLLIRGSFPYLVIMSCSGG